MLHPLMAVGRTHTTHFLKECADLFPLIDKKTVMDDFCGLDFLFLWYNLKSFDIDVDAMVILSIHAPDSHAKTSRMANRKMSNELTIFANLKL